MGTSGDNLALARFTADGSLDTTFSSDGMLTVSMALPAGLEELAFDVAVQADGRVLLAGVSSAELLLARLTAGGELDTGFGGGDGMVTTNVAGGACDAVGYALEVGPDGRVTVVGEANYSFGVARYLMPEGLEERLYAQQDANFNVTSIADVFGEVVERYEYAPYGERTVLDADFTPDSVSGDGRSDYEFLHGHQGGRHDLVTGLVNFRRREYSTALGRWVQQDPMGYVDGMNVYEYVSSSPVAFLDPLGTAKRNPPVEDVWEPGTGSRPPGYPRDKWDATHAGPSVALPPLDVIEEFQLSGTGLLFPPPYGGANGGFGSRVTVVLSPNSAVGMKYTDVPLKDPKVLGQVTSDFDLFLFAGETPSQPGCWQIRGFLTVTSVMELDLARARARRTGGQTSPSGQEYTASGVYGHEQRHVENTIYKAWGLASLIEAEVDHLGDRLTLDQATRFAQQIDDKYTALWEWWRLLERGHEWPGGPAAGEPYPPRGDVPDPFARPRARPDR